MEKLLGRELYREILKNCDFEKVTEIRLRLNKPTTVKVIGDKVVLSHVSDGIFLEQVIKNATNNSRYAYEDEMSNGYIDYAGGVRIGIGGDCKISCGGVIALRKAFSLCIRVPHEIIGCASGLMNILDDFENTLIISPPGGGKTTLLREISRLLSMRYNVLIIDEREEICGKGLCLRTGDNCDVIQGIQKYAAFERAIRTMSPEIIVCDELFGQHDLAAVKRMSGAGIKVLATLHSDSDVVGAIKEVFCNRVILSSKPTPGSIVSIIRGTAAD